jgi:DNA-binding MarR family transcriptional regulator
MIDHKLALTNFDKAFESRIRLQIMTVLAANEKYDFNSLKDLLHATSGNLASHLKYLEKDKYIVFTKSFLGRKANTRYKASIKGINAFKRHLATLENLITEQKRSIKNSCTSQFC